jgi:hypothetical protein
MDEKNNREETGTPLSGHLETFLWTQSIAREMFGDSRSMTNEEYEILKKTFERTLSKEPTRFTRKQ